MNWQYKISLNKVLSQLNDEFDFEKLEAPCPQEAKTAIAVEIARALPLKRFRQQIIDCQTIAEMNRVLERIYDAADRSKVWCGFPG